MDDWPKGPTNAATGKRPRSRRRRAPPSVQAGLRYARSSAAPSSAPLHVSPTLAISCEAVPASIMGRRGHEPAPPVGHGAGESFVSFIALFGRVARLLGKTQLSAGCYSTCPFVP